MILLFYLYLYPLIARALRITGGASRISCQRLGLEPIFKNNIQLLYEI